MGSGAISAQLVIDSDRGAGAWILTLSGELDLASSQLLEDQLARAESADPNRLVLDLSSLEFIDTTGIATLLRAQNRSLEHGHQLSIRRGPRAVHSIFELSNTTSRFDFAD